MKAANHSVRVRRNSALRASTATLEDFLSILRERNECHS